MIGAVQVRRPRAAPALAVLLAGTGILHFIVPAPIDALVPTALPGDPRFWTLLSGLAELAVAAAVAVPRTRRLGGLAAAVLFVAVFPGNVKMAIDWSDRSLPEQALAYGRLPLQVPLVWWALTVYRKARRSPSHRSTGTVTPPA
ncbi:MAG: DoxX family protein [Pseudonocardia sp.]